MAQSLVVDGPSTSNISVRFVNKWSSNGHGGRHSGLYYVMVASSGLFTNAMALKLEETSCLVCFHYLWLTCPQNIAWFQLILQRIVTFYTSSAQA